ncbi:uncharacterized protein C8A04DRAFT_26994 [Dichotomopilus funicola]|uniref:Uncharacterized protein n=1 Tax=Dichotomopilus funicola TaxID=1934379 RepID=A0AAN6V5M8_9PEZI|nr:hypothetical protein C8A04DRAFT_26994 [Dichotomopilus funicola]
MAPILRQSAVLTFTPYMSERCDRLAQLQDEPSDVYLAALIRLQALNARWGIAFPAPENSFGPPRAFDDTTYMAITSAIEELEVIGRSLPNSIRNDVVLWTIYAQSRIVRFTHTAIHQHVATTTTTVPNHLHDINHFNRATALRTCLTACVGTIRSYLAIPPLDLATTCPVMTTCSLGIALLTLRHLLLSLNDDPDWDTAAARSVVDAEGMIDGLCDLFKDSYLALQEDSDRRTGTEGSDLSSPGLSGEDGWGLIAGGSSYREMQVVEMHGSGKLTRALADMELANDKAGPAVLGYWKKLRWFKSWYLDANFSNEHPAAPEGTRCHEHNNAPNSESLPDPPEEFTDEIWAGMAGPEDILGWDEADLVSTGL